MTAARVWWGAAALAVGACHVQPTPAPAPAQPPPQDRPAMVAQPADSQPVEEPPEPERGFFYGPDEALADLMSGPLIFVGAGEWQGIFRGHSCVYRNERVFVVDVYCSKREKRVFSVRIFSPTRGRAKIYAEGDKPVSQMTRDDYVMWTIESEPPPSADRIEPVALEMTYEQLLAYAEAKYKLYPDACWRTIRSGSGCLRGLEGRTSEWDDVSKTFHDEPGQTWYETIGLMRTHAKINGR